MTIDPGAGIQLEVERGMASMIEQHTAWLELCAAGHRGEEYEWRTSELLSCLRSIEWDLQDLEDAVSIIEGNRQKFSELDDDSVATRRALIDSVRRKIDHVRESVQEAASVEGGHSASAKKSSAIPGLKKECRYGKLHEDDGGTPKAVGAATAALAAMSAAARTATACATGSSSGGAVGGGGSGTLSCEDSAAAMELPDGVQQRRWWLCCC